MSETPNRYPLAWPAGRPRRKPGERKRGDFSMTTGEGQARSKKVNVETAAQRLEEQVERLGGVYAILSTNLELRMDGRPRADRGAPVDPGAVVYFQLNQKPYAMACDTFDEVAQNIAALAAHIEATRRIERYGVASAAETLQAFSALPPPATGPQVAIARPWRDVLGFKADFGTSGFGLMPEQCVMLVRDAHRTKAKALGEGHADLGELNMARDAALKELCHVQ
jgi:hypothetical protein